MLSSDLSGAKPLEVPWIPLGGLPIAVIDNKDSAKLMIDVALSRRGSGQAPLVVTSANGQVLSMCARDERVRSFFFAADLIHADGMPLIFASRLRSRTHLPERVATTDLFHDVARVAQSRKGSFYFLGGKPAVVEKAVHNVQARYPGLNVVGFQHGYFDSKEINAVISDINTTRPDVLWIGLGVPREQEFAFRYRSALTNVGLIKTSGGLFDFLSGNTLRAPGWMQSAGLEWLYRLWLEPRRLFYRYLTSNPHAFVLLLTRSRLAAKE